MKKENKKLDEKLSLGEFVRAHTDSEEDSQNKQNTKKEGKRTMKNTNTAITINTTINTTSEVKDLKGGKTMKNTIKNTIKENRLVEQEAKAEQARMEEREARLAEVKPVDIVGTMDEVYEESVRADRNEEGISMGTNGGKYYQTPMRTPDGRIMTIAANSLEELEELKEKIENGFSGDGKYHKTLIIGGVPCECVGATLEELEEDIQAAHEYAIKHMYGSVLRDIDIAEQLVDAGFRQKDLEQVEDLYGETYLICYNGNYVMNLKGETIVDLSDLKGYIFKEDAKTLLMERLNKWAEENHVEEDDDCDYEDYDDDYDDYDEDEEDWDEDDDEDEWDY